MVSRSGKRPVDALAIKVLDAAKDHRSVVDSVDVDARQGLGILDAVRKALQLALGVHLPCVRGPAKMLALNVQQ